MATLLVICGTILLIYFIMSVKKKYQYFIERGIPFPRPYWPLGNFWRVGLTVHFINRINETYRNFKNKGKICGFFIFTIPVYVILDIDLIKNILVKDFDSFHDRGIYYNEKADPLSAHIFSVIIDKKKK
jgi:cytochrome P450 family 6